MENGNGIVCALAGLAVEWGEGRGETRADCEKCLGNALNSVSCNWDNAWVNYGDEPAEAEAWPGLVVAGMQSTWQTLLQLRRPVEIFMKTPASSWVSGGGCRHLNFAAQHETYSFWGNFKCHKLLTPVVRRLKVSKTLVRPLSLSLTLCQT